MKEKSIEAIVSMIANTPRTVRNIRERIINRVLEAGGETMSRHHFEVLKALDEDGRMSITELGGILVISKSQMTRLISELSTAGLVSREADPGDRRKSIVALTDKGERSISHVNERFHQTTMQILQPLSEQELDELSISLGKITQVTQKIL